MVGSLEIRVKGASVKFSYGVIAGALVVLVAACGGNPASGSGSTPPANVSTSAAPVSTPTTTPPPDLNAELLNGSELAGWSGQANSDAGEPKCLDKVRSALGTASKAQATFTHGSNGLPVLEESLYYVPGHGQSDMAVVKQTLAGCGAVTMSSGGATFTGSMGSLLFPAVADQSSAYKMYLSGTISGQSLTLAVDLVVFRKADTVAIILYGNLGSASKQALKPLVRDAAAKVQ
jgi:hypothetical protein